MNLFRPLLRPAVVIGCAGIVLALPCLLYGFPFYGDDSVSHAISYAHFASELWSGNFYPRWLPQMNAGLGSAFFIYYSPLPYYLTSLLKPLFPHDQQGWIQLGVGAAAAIVFSGYIFFGWLREHADSRGAGVAAIVYMVLPYHLNVDLYTRGAYSELWAFVAMPLVLLTVDRSTQDHHWSRVLLAPSYAFLILVNLPTALIFSPVVVLYGLLTFKRDRLKKFLWLVINLGIGLGLAAIYLVPAIALKRFSYLSEGTSGHYFYGNWFLFTGLDWANVRSEIFWSSIALIPVCVVAFLLARAQRSASHTQIRFWFLVSIVCGFFMTALSRPIWTALPLLQEIQFPWRFNAIASVSAAALIGLAFTGRSIRETQTVALAVLLVIVGGFSLTDLVRRAWSAYPLHYIDQAVVQERTQWIKQQRDQNEYRPRWVASLREEDLSELLKRLGKTSDRSGVAELDGAGTVVITRWDRQGITLSSQAPAPATVRVSQFYFPGWRAVLDENVELEVKPSLPDGLVSVVVPEGNHSILVQRIYTSPELVGASITLASIGLWLGLTVFRLVDLIGRLRYRRADL